ncbi:MAG TPA: sigma factor-like helix-turn-helix DNA-binding protein [Anaerolineae bacterium]|nr:sigma factor-like helix-turn-helix DNA-binding protein [Anaerolineae bacterium]
MDANDVEIQESFWYHRPRAERLAAAQRWAGVPLASLGLGVRPYNALMRLGAYPDVAALMLCGTELEVVRNLGIGSIRSIHEALARCFADAHAPSTHDAAPEAPSWPPQYLARLQEAIQTLTDRKDSSSLILAELGWPLRLISLCPGPSLSQVVQLSPEQITELCRTLVWQPGMGEMLAERLELLVALPEDPDDAAWAALWRAQGIDVIPDAYAAGGRVGLVQAVEHLIQHSILADRDEADWIILTHRHGLAGAEEYTLEELGDTLGVTRERVRQREVKSLQQVSAWLADPAAYVAPKRIHPAVSRFLASLNQYFSEVMSKPVQDPDFIARTNAMAQVRGSKANPLVTMMAGLVGVQRVSLGRKGLGDVWSGGDSAQRRHMAWLLVQLHEILNQDTAEALSGVALTIALNRRSKRDQKLTLNQVAPFIDLCSSIERLSDGRLRGRFSTLATRALQMERLLAEANEPLHLSEILRRLNHQMALSGDKPMKSANLGNQLAADDRFVPIGRSGEWALSRWDSIETGTILDLMERCLIEHDSPRTQDDIYRWVAERRPVSESSIAIYLSGAQSFVRADGDRWALRQWQREPRTRRPRAGGGKVIDRCLVAAERMLRQQPDGQMPLSELRNRLMKELGVPSASVYSFVSRLPQLETFPDPAGSGKLVRLILAEDPG